ncbi:hypothetical protein EJP77_04750 [Paenibacillus zeisoli]|uniref:Uncharacterized protein n=1 Tax=Paenibacillus zeisoli TaxID=2496267 RepID=A0A3S1E299_9BACL|nr:hypothetical protein [Paenibacillus zeisoli]RUT36302.1 hypothetical protein EJP77_04750 [Paenibacillus zeisoli]
MKKRLFLLATIVSLLFTFSSVSIAKEKTPKDILKSKYPNEVVTLLKTDDINFDKKKESFLLTETGNFYLINSKGSIVLIDTGLNSDYFDELQLKIFAVTKNEKHIAVIGTYLPSNTQAFVYRLKNGTLTKVLDVMGDVDVQIDAKGRIHQLWKNFKPGGGWDLARGTFSWSVKSNKYIGTGHYVLK